MKKKMKKKLALTQQIRKRSSDGYSTVYINFRRAPVRVRALSVCARERAVPPAALVEEDFEIRAPRRRAGDRFPRARSLGCADLSRYSISRRNKSWKEILEGESDTRWNAGPASGGKTDRLG